MDPHWGCGEDYEDKPGVVNKVQLEATSSNFEGKRKKPNVWDKALRTLLNTVSIVFAVLLPLISNLLDPFMFTPERLALTHLESPLASDSVFTALTQPNDSLPRLEGEIVAIVYRNVPLICAMWIV